MSQFRFNRYGSTEPSVWLWLILFNGLAHLLWLMPVFRQMVGSWSEVAASPAYLPGVVVILVLLYTWFNRIPAAGVVLRSIWHYGRSILIAAYIWFMFCLILLHGSALFRTDHGHFSAVLILLLINLVIISYLWASTSARRVFADFPLPSDLALGREAAKSKAQERQKFAREVRLSTPVAQNAEQEKIEVHWRAEALRHPEQARPWIELGVLAYECGQTEQALTMMEHAEACEPDNPVVLRNLCEILRQKGRLTKAIGYGRKAVTMAPRDEIAHLNLAQALVDDGKADLALSEYHRVLELNPQDAKTWLNMVVLLVRQERQADALAALEAVLLIEPENDQAMAIKEHLRINT